MASHSVLGDLAYFDWVSDRKGERCLLLLVLVVLTRVLRLLPLNVKVLNLFDKMRLGRGGPHSQISANLSCVLLAVLVVLRLKARRVGRHLTGLFSHELGALSSEAYRHLILLLSGGGLMLLLLGRCFVRICSLLVIFSGYFLRLVLCLLVIAICGSIKLCLMFLIVEISGIRIMLSGSRLRFSYGRSSLFSLLSWSFLCLRLD